MTLPHQHNCPHTPEGWCLDCVGELVDSQSNELESLGRSNAKILDQYRRNHLLSTNIPNGIACPKCGAELVDKDRFRVTMMKMPQTRIECLVCKYEGMRNT